jgi:hypothetical protein
MRAMLGHRPSPAMIVALIALFVALGGVSYGVATGSIDSREIKNNSVRSDDVRNRSLSGRDIRLNTLGGAEIRESLLRQVPSAARADSATSARSATNAANAASAQNATNAANAGNAANLGNKPAARYLSDVRLVPSSSASDSTSPKTATASCAAGEQIVGGGGHVTGGTDEALQSTRPVEGTPDVWEATGVETDADVGNWSVTSYALCGQG